MKIHCNLLKKTSVILVVLMIFACQSEKKEDKTSESTQETTMSEEKKPSNISTIFAGTINGLNNEANEDRSVTGEVTLTILTDKTLNIQVNASGLEPNTMHAQMLHGSKEGADTKCTGMEADKNNDGYVDVTEAVPSVGITMIPLHENPLNLTIKTDTYPKADENGNLEYLASVNIDSLSNAWKAKFGLETFDLTKFTYVLHGVDTQLNLPASAASVLEMPAHMTLPVGCAVIEKKDTAAY